MAGEHGCNLSFDGLRQRRAGAVAQDISQRIDKSSWLAELENISLGHGVSLLRWRSGGVEHPYDTPPTLHAVTNFPGSTVAHAMEKQFSAFRR
jgi:hypothetical protein